MLNKKNKKKINFIKRPKKLKLTYTEIQNS